MPGGCVAEVGVGRGKGGGGGVDKDSLSWVGGGCLLTGVG